MIPATKPDTTINPNENLASHIDTWNKDRSDDQLHSFVSKLVGRHESIELETA